MAEPPIASLLQLASAALPIGGFSYSAGLESAVERGLVGDLASAAHWLDIQLGELWAQGEAAVWSALFCAWRDADVDAITAWNDWLLAARDSQESALESEQMGRSLALWLLALPDLPTLPDKQRSWLRVLRPISHVCAHACAAWALQLSPRAGLQALGWSLLENATAAAVKLIPLGQDDGQALLRRSAANLDRAVAVALTKSAQEACNFSPMLGVLCAEHETQYSRLFRS